MKILEIKVMRGPNYWSLKHRALIVMKIDTGNFSNDQIESFMESAINKMPFLSEKYHIKEYKENKIVNAIKDIALELQFRVGMNYGFSKIQPVEKNPNHYYIIYPYEIEKAGIYAGEASVRIAEAINENKPYNLEDDIEELKYIKSRYAMGPTNQYLLEEIKRRNIPYQQFNNSSLLLLGYGQKQKRTKSAVTDSTSGLGMEMASDKDETKQMLDNAHIPVPKGTLLYNEEELLQYLDQIKFPIVVKPLDGNHGRGVTTNINSIEGALFGFSIAKQVSDYVIVEEFIEGNDYRFLVINYELVAVAKRMRASVTGNGKYTIAELIEEANKNPDRAGGDSVLAPLKADEITRRILAEKHLTLNDVLPSGEILILKDTANISAGGVALDVTDKVHHKNKFLAERIARIFKLDICGVDIMATAIDVPINRDVGAVIEVNAGPGLRMHSNPQDGTPRNVAEPIIKMLFPEIESARIPVIAVAGTNVKTIVYLIAEIAKRGGYKPGYNTEDGIYIDGYMTYEGDCTGYLSAQDVLFDPLINFAIIECDTDGIIRSGLGFDHCNICIITDIPTGNFESKENIFTSDVLVKVISVMAKSTYNNGYVILNADNDEVFAMANELNCKVALFSMSSESDRIKTHYKNGGLAAVIENDYVTVYNGNQKNIFFKINTDFSDKSENAVKYTLPTILAAVIYKFKTVDIIDSLQSFVLKGSSVAETID